MFCRHEILGLKYLLNLDCSAVIWLRKLARAVLTGAFALGGFQEGFRMYSCGINLLFSS